jgi:predicted adenine nucleotide alpha hydrolase (AANH) superfamily ATPase
VETFLKEDIPPDLFWFNPNIHPFVEYRARRDTLIQFGQDRNLRVITEDEYGLRSFIRGIYPDLEQSGGSRCAYCYRVRLEKTAATAAGGGYDAFSSSLLISPYQNHDLLRQAGEDAAARYGVRFYYRDFRPRFREGRNQARELGFYMQKYCGCIFSEEERYRKAGIRDSA